MPYQGHGQAPFPDHRRVHRATDPELRGQAPAERDPIENANQVQNAVAVTLNRAGSHRRNPVLAGLGFELTIPLGLSDDLKGLYLYQKPGKYGLNLKGQATPAAPGVFSYKFLVGSGQSLAGNPTAGPVRNYVRVQTARGGYEREFWAQSYEHDVVTLNDENALHPSTLEPVEIVAEIVDASRDWLEIRTDFMPGWNDEFLNLHRSETTDVERGFAKANGGAAFVSFFDTAPGTEGIGTQVNPVNQQPIEARRTIQVENTEGLKEITARFRSKIDSEFFVDVPLLIRVTDQDEICLAPMTMPCTDLYSKSGSSTPAGMPSIASTPMVQVVAGPDSTIAQDLLYITIRGATVGGAPKLRLQRWSLTPSGTALQGARLVELEAVDYLPLVQAAGIPETEAPYGAPKRYTIALSIVQLKNDNVAFMNAVLVDGTKPGMPVLVLGPKARDLGYIPIGSGGVGTGGGPVCAAY